MGRKRQRTAPGVALLKPGGKNTKTCGKKLTRSQHLVEQSFQICLHIVCVLHANGLLMGEEPVRVKKHLQATYNPVIGQLYDFAREEQNEY